MDKGGKTGKIIYGKVYLDDPKTKDQYFNFVKNYADLLVESGGYTSGELYDLMPRPAVLPVNATMAKGPLPADITTGPSLEATRGPAHFTETDQAEIARHAETFPAVVRRDEYTAQAAALKQKLVLTWRTPEEEKRFTNLLI